jgi:glycosyltransferase involved in cell wall biosynthesis
VFTVFTPTYNRAHTLHRAYDSLQQQTCRDFEWLIVDDGSTDDTASLVERWRTTAPFPIRYIRQTNQGKHAAYNRATAEAAGEWFVNLDSDDACVSEALARFAHHWRRIPTVQQSAYSAVVCLCLDQHGHLVGDRFPQDDLDADYRQLRYRYRVRGEKWACHRTDVLRQFPFPTTPTADYLPEGIVWSRIARQYRERCVNEALRIYWTDAPSLMRGRSPRQSALGGALQHLESLNGDAADYFWFSPGEFLRSAVHYARFSFHAGAGPGRQWSQLRGIVPRALWAAMAPLGALVYGRDCWRGA